MFLDISEEIVGLIIGIPFAMIILIPTIVAILYFVYLVLETIRYKSKASLIDVQVAIGKEMNLIPNYEPAVMGYLVNYQKIGKREICSTLFDLIGRGIIKITLKSGFISDENSKYILEKNIEDDSELKDYEKALINYLFRNGKTIKNETLNERLYKKNLSEKFYKNFLKSIQEDAKMYDFFSPKIGKKKIFIYKVINKVVTVIATVMSFITTIALEGLDAIDDFEVGIGILGFCLVTALTLWILKFLISFMFNITCYYNDFSENGIKEYRQWKEFKKFLKNCSSIPDHPLMGVMVWERYYAYSIGLKCSKKFFKQMKKMKVVDNSIDISIIETFNFISSTIGTSTKKLKSISLDKHGGSHVDY